MNPVTDLIIKEKDNDAVFVFPSEAAAVNRRKEFLRITGKGAVRNSRFLSWDRFKEQITLHDKIKKPVNSILRRLFSAETVQSNSRQGLFTRLIPGEFSSQAGAFTDTICRVLPELEKLIKIIDGPGFPDSALAADYKKLYHEYVRFMEANNLFEPSWEAPDLKELSGLYYIICPEIIEDYGEFEDLLKRAGCRVVSAAFTESPEIRLFGNSVIETDIVLNEISALLNSGVHYSGIAVSAADDETAEMLLSGARLRNINLNRRSGKPLSGYPAGRLPGLIRACRSSGYSAAAMKDLLFYRAFIWKDADTAAELVRFGIENRCLKNTSAGPSGDVWEQRLKAIRQNDPALQKAMLGFYRKLKSGIESVCKSHSFSELSNKFQAFISTFLDTGPEKWDPECERVFQRTREVLSLLRETVELLEDISITDPLGLWIELLDEKIYVQQHHSCGIDLYPYRVSALINPEYHFVVGLSHETSTVVSRAFPFLSDQQRKGIGAQERIMTDDFIKTYALSGHNVRFSCSSDTYAGVSLPPGLFIEGGNINRIKSHDMENDFFSAPAQAENLWWEKACNAGFRVAEAGPLPVLSEMQLSGFGYASRTFMSEKGFDATDGPFPEDFTAGRIAPLFSDKDSGYFRVSATALDRWTACPFNMLLSDGLGIFEDKYILRAEDPWTAGSVMHDILFRFFKMLTDAGTPFSISGRTDEYRDMIRGAVAEVFRSWENGGNYFYGPAWASLKRRALQDLLLFPAAEAGLYDGYSPVMLEQWLDFSIDEAKIRVTGRVDRISEGADGVVIVDYKRTWKKQTRPQFIQEDENGGLLPPRKGYQLPFYILLARANGMKVAGTSYYGISAAEHFPVSGAFGVLNDEEVERLCDLTMNEILRMAAGCRKGDFTAAERCDGCGFRAVCRKRFNVRWTG